MATTPSFRRRVRCEGLGYAVGFTPYDHGVRLDLLGRRIVTPWRSVNLADAIGRGGFRRVTWREGTKGKMSSRFATERVVLAQDDLVDPSQREAVWLLMEWPHGEKARRTLRDHVAGEHVTAPARSESQAAVAHRTGVRGRQGRAWLDHYEGRSFRGWNHHVSMVLVCFAFIVAERSRAFPPRPEKLPRGKRRIVTTVRTATRPERHFRDSFITVRLAVARVLATWLPRCPLCHRPRSMGPPGAHAREHRRTTPF